MKKYFADPIKVFGFFVLVCIIPGPIALGFIASSEPYAVVLGVALLVCCLYPVYVKVRYPVLAIKDGQLVKRNILGKETIIDLPAQTELIVSVDYLALRKNGKDEIFIDKGWFSRRRWEFMLSDLRNLATQTS